MARSPRLRLRKPVPVGEPDPGEPGKREIAHCRDPRDVGEGRPVHAQAEEMQESLLAANRLFAVHEPPVEQREVPQHRDPLEASLQVLVDVDPPSPAARASRCARRCGRAPGSGLRPSRSPARCRGSPGSRAIPRSPRPAPRARHRPGRRACRGRSPSRGTSWRAARIFSRASSGRRARKRRNTSSSSRWAAGLRQSWNGPSTRNWPGPRSDACASCSIEFRRTFAVRFDGDFAWTCAHSAIAADSSPRMCLILASRSRAGRSSGVCSSTYATSTSASYSSPISTKTRAYRSRSSAEDRDSSCAAATGSFVDILLF